MTLLWVSGCPFILVPCGGFDFGPSLWVLGAGLGGWVIFPLGKNNSLRSDIFFLAGKNNPTPRPSQYRGIGREDKAQQTNYQGPTSGAGSTPPSRNSEADLPVHFRNARLKLDRSA